MHPPGLAAKLKFLQAPPSYGASVTQVECLETHMSWVFLVDQLVYKLKKPVCFPFLDFTTLKAREFYCREEIRLNARMAPGVYCGVVALQWNQDTLALVPDALLPAPGKTVDWLVLMRKLPLQRTLHQLIEKHRLTPSELSAVVELLAAFYRAAPRIALGENDYLARFQYEQASNREVLLRPQFQLRDAALAMDRFDAALALVADLLRARASGLRIVDGHGDLRPEHVFLLQPPAIIDCLEFNPQLRQLDPFAEIAYLSLECSMAGAPWVGPFLVQGLADALNDQAPPALLDFYKARSALLRARLAMAHLLDPQPRLPLKWAPLAARYVTQALAASDAIIATRQHGKP